MCFFCKLSEKKRKKLDCLDYYLYIIFIAAITIALVRIFPALTFFNWYFYILIAGVAIVRPIRKITCKKNCDNVNF